MNDVNDWEPTRFGGLRRSRPRVAQLVEHLPDLEKADSAQEERRGRARRAVDGSREVLRRSTWVGFKSLPADKFVLKFNERLGLPSCPYVVRWRLETPWGSIRLHHWLAPDDDRAKHDHPWNFITFVLRGGYTDASPDGDEHLRAPAVRYRSAEHQHTVFPDPGGAWTIIVTGPKIRVWGFWVNGKFRKMNKYFYMFGHHPCD